MIADWLKNFIAFSGLPVPKLNATSGLAVGAYAGVAAAPSNGAIISGTVGIGTSSPNSKMQIVGGSLHVGSGANILGSQEGIEIIPGVGNASSILSRSTTGDVASADFVTGGALVTGWSIQMPASQTYLHILDRVNNLPRVVLTNSGNFGVGTTSPRVQADINGPLAVKSYSKAALPPASAAAGQIIYVTDDIGGSVIAFSDAVNWRRTSDRAIIS